MKSIVIYNSKRGSTEQYARWIAKDIRAEQCVALDQADLHSLDQFDEVVFGGWIRGSGIVGLDKIKKTAPDVAPRLVVFGVGIAPASPENYMQVLEINLDDDSGHWKDVPMHILPGRYDPEKVQGMDRFLMAVAKRVMISGRVSRSDRGAAAMKAALEKGMDRMSRSAVEPVVRTVLRKSGLTREEEDEKIEALKPQWKTEGLTGDGLAGYSGGEDAGNSARNATGDTSGNAAWNVTGDFTGNVAGKAAGSSAGNTAGNGLEMSDHESAGRDPSAPDGAAGGSTGPDDDAGGALAQAGTDASVDPADTDAIMAEMLKRHDE